MNQRRRLTAEERQAAAAEMLAQKPGKQLFVQEWTDPDGMPIIVTILEP